ncbi:MAG: undecaprenyl-diphosphate phosphatase [Kiritimatiellia bacterium]
METLKLIVLALVQALTEFLPVSSSGHLVFAKNVLDIESKGVLLELLLHAGTLGSVCVYYRKRLWKLVSGVFRLEWVSIRYALYILLSMVPAGLLYASGGNRISEIYETSGVVCWLMVLNGLFLLSTGLFERRWRRRAEERAVSEGAAMETAPAEGGLSAWRVLAMGIGQAIAVLPGISRSGTSISAGRFAGLDSRIAAEFSFVMSIPVIAGAALLEFLKALEKAREMNEPLAGGYSGLELLSGMAISFVAGYLALALLIRMIGRGRLWVFGVYCVVAGLLAACFGI